MLRIYKSLCLVAGCARDCLLREGGRLGRPLELHLEDRHGPARRARPRQYVQVRHGPGRQVEFGSMYRHSKGLGRHARARQYLQEQVRYLHRSRRER